jgi:uncharacterized protein
MNCPRCVNTQLLMTDRQGVEIDYCPQCRGVWLDRGELDKIIERSAAQYEPSSQVKSNEYYDGKHDKHHDDHHGHHKRKSLLRELFD